MHAGSTGPLTSARAAADCEPGEAPVPVPPGVTQLVLDAPQYSNHPSYPLGTGLTNLSVLFSLPLVMGSDKILQNMAS